LAIEEEALPRVSVVMPAWQAELTVGAAVSSVRWQTYPDLELVVVDDGSTDATADIVAAFGKSVRLVRQGRRGIAASRNRGIAEARGELVAFCDADDLLFPNHIEALVDCYDRRGGGIVTGNAWLFFRGGIHRGKTRHKGRFPHVRMQRQAILEQNFVSIMSLFPRRLVDEIGPFQDGFTGAEDWEFWMRAIYAGHAVLHQPRPMALYRWTAVSMSAQRELTDAAVMKVLEQARDHLHLTPDERKYVERRLSGADPRQHGRLGDDALRQQRYAEAARHLRQAAELCPTERALVWKARTLSVAPRLIGPLVRARQLRAERAIGFDEGHIR
jgi:glycosyltransferase involved in cell wall biosynthesis